MHFSKQKLKLVGVLSVAVLALAGCSNPSLAASVNGREISEKDVDRAANGCAEVWENSANDLRRDMVNNMIMASLAAYIAEEKGITITPEERKQFLESTTAGRLMLGDSECAKVADGLAFYLLTYDRIGQESFIGLADAAKISVNPRYGVWDPEKGSLDGTGSLSELAPNHE